MAPRVTPAEVAFSLIAGLAGLAGSYAVAGDASAFVATPVATAVVNWTPAPVVTLSILVLGTVGTTLALVLALGLAAVLLAAAAVLGYAMARRLARPTAAPVATLVLAWFVAAGLTGAPARALAAALPTAVVVGGSVAVAVVGRRGADVDSPTRRDLLVALGGVVGFGALAALVGTRGWLAEAADDGDEPGVERQLAAARATSLGVEGLDPIVSTEAEFYEVDISLVNPTVAAEEWSLTVDGAVDTPLELSYADVLDLPRERRFVTLRCVGDPLNGQQMDTALWTGVPLAEVLDRAGPRAAHVRLRGVDGYEVSFPLPALRAGLLAYRMNGLALPRKHGFPVRALVPGRWGETNVKWITGIEVVADPEPGYWERRGWEGTGEVITVAKLWAVNRLDDGRVRLGGYAYAGTRGVDRVEVSVDGGDTWREADLSVPLGEDVWRQWALTYEPPDGGHEAVVRAVDGTGAVQPREPEEPFPRGASGWVSRTIEG